MRFLVATSAPTFWQPQAEDLAKAIRRRGHDAHVLIPSGANRSIAPCDVLLCIGSGESLRPFLDAVQSKAKILYLIESIPTPTEADGFTRSKLAVHEPYLREFGTIFVHSPRSIAALRAMGTPRVEPLTWPHFPGIFHPIPNSERDIDVLFAGTLSPHRKKLLDIACGRFNVTVCSNLFHGDLVSLYNRSKIILNIHFTPLRNFECRVMEALGCGAFVLTERLDPEDLLLDGEHLGVFDEDTMLDVIDRYLRDPAERDRIARAGHAEVQKYAVEVQVERILEEAAALLKVSFSPPDRTPNSQTANDQKAKERALLRWHPESRKRADLPTKNPSKLPTQPTSTSAPGTLNRTGAAQATVTIKGRPYTVSYPRSQAIDYMLEEIFVKNAYPYLPFLAPVSGVILDVGANIGCTVLLFQALYPNAEIFAFEPEREAFKYLTHNTSFLKNVHRCPFGLCDRDGVARLFKGKGTSTTNSIGRSSHNTEHYEDVPVRRLSSFLAEQQISRVSLLKIDTEGMEVPILRDIEPYLDRVDGICLEYHSERDRLEIDRLLTDRFMLCHANASLVHRGTVAYASTTLIASRTSLDRLEVVRPF